LRADATFALPAVYEYCEAEGIAYTMALINNCRLEEHVGFVGHRPCQIPGQQERLYHSNPYLSLVAEPLRRIGPTPNFSTSSLGFIENSSACASVRAGRKEEAPRLNEGPQHLRGEAEFVVSQ
jgi:hypothetical protein